MLHRRTIIRLVVAVVATGLFTACGGSSGGSSGSEYEAGTAQEFYRSLNEIERLGSCEQRFKCPRSFGRVFATTTQHKSLEACKSGGTGFSQFPPALRRDLEDGRIEYDQQLGERCIQELADLIDGYEPQCDEPPITGQLSPECRDIQVLNGTVSKGNACRTSFACQEGLECEVPENACGGTCVEPSDTPADSPDKQKGASCSNDSECAFQLSCAPAENGQSGKVCIEWYSRSEGAACDTSQDCSPQLTCEQGTCTSWNLVSEGDTCEQSFGTLDICEPGTHCYSGPETMEATCQTFVDEGGSCEEDSACAGSLYCVEGTCQPPKAPGESCSSDAECGSRPCREDGTCAPYGKEACYPSNVN